MLTDPKQAFVLSASLVVAGALVALPSVISTFPLNLLLLVLPVGVCLLIPYLHRKDDRLDASQTLLEVAGTWIGYAAAFHAYHGFWDGQGIGVGLVGFVIMGPVTILLARHQRASSIAHSTKGNGSA
ncbi:MAG: hypothetical protein WD151_03240 [Phycisphaeraceae bacterium]